MIESRTGSSSARIALLGREGFSCLGPVGKAADFAKVSGALSRGWPRALRGEIEFSRRPQVPQDPAGGLRDLHVADTNDVKSVGRFALAVNDLAGSKLNKLDLLAFGCGRVG